MEEDKKHYELTVLLENEDNSSVRSLIEKNKGVNIKISPFAKIELAYPVKKKTQAYMVVFDFEMNPSSVGKLEKDLRINEDVLRHLLLRVNMKEEKPKKEKSKQALPDVYKKADDIDLLSNEALEKKIKEIST